MKALPLRILPCLCLLLTGWCLAWGELLAADPVRDWQPLAEDGLHDPKGPAIGELQQPVDALKPLPPDTIGNLVRWVLALRDGHIQPRTNIHPETKIQILDLDLVYGRTGDYPFVRFPHKPHTEWLDCENCHDKIFKTKFAASGMNMMKILEGQYCGICHGAVAFPLTECTRCHSVDPDKFRGTMGPQPTTATAK